MLQVLPASVRSVPPDGTAEQPLPQAVPTASNLSTATVQAETVVEDGRIIHWPGFEALLHHALYEQASTKSLWISLPDPAPNMLCVLQLAWQMGEEGSVIMPEPLFTSRVRQLLQVCSYAICNAATVMLRRQSGNS